MTGVFFSPAALTNKAMGILCLHFFPPLHCFPFMSKHLTGSALQKQPVLSMFHMSSLLYPHTSSGSLSFHDFTVSQLTSPDSPQTLTLLTLDRFLLLFQLSTGAFENTQFYAFSYFSSLLCQLRAPGVDTLREVASWYHLYRASFTCANAKLQGLFSSIAGWQRSIGLI